MEMCKKKETEMQAHRDVNAYGLMVRLDRLFIRVFRRRPLGNFSARLATGSPPLGMTDLRAFLG